jgi:hypothetical protein
MRRDRISRVKRALGATIGVVLLVLGVGEFVTHLDEPLSLFFWLPSLWGGGALILVGVFRATARPWLSEVLVIVGALLGFLATAWTLLMPVLLLTLVVLTIVRMPRQAPTSA